LHRTPDKPKQKMSQTAKILAEINSIECSEDAMKLHNLKTTLQKNLQTATCLALIAFSNAAMAVGDMPGGPKVNQLDLHAPVTKIATDIQWLHNFMMIVCIAIFIAVFGVMFYSVFKHRKSKGAVPATFHESVAVEIAWTAIPMAIVIAMGYAATTTVVAMKDTTGADITIKATGYQWKWGYDYLKGEGEGIAFFSTLSTPRDQINGKAAKSDTYLMEVDNEVVLPIGKKIRVVTTANDVIHAWMVPSFGVKQDAIPGFVRDTWFKAEKIGTYRGQCAELCGKEHAFMPIVVKIVSPEDYTKWVNEKQKVMLASAEDPNKVWDAAALKTKGEAVYKANCVSCHQPTGLGVAGAFPALDGDKLVLGAKAEQINVLLNGQGNGKMPAWKALSDVEIASVITYTRNAWSNAGKGTDPVVQPADVKAARK
jgi:cytochrome c oxidase subunit II